MEFVYDPEVRLYVADDNCDRIDYAPDGTIEREFRDGKEVIRTPPGVIKSKETRMNTTEKER
jgi:hypothetical protein